MFQKLKKMLVTCFIPRDFVRVTFDGTFAIMKPADACDMLMDSDNPREYKVTNVQMTMRKFNALNEFTGY